MSVKVNGDNFESEVISSGELVIADFYSDQCVACKRISPFLAEIDSEYESVRLAKININFSGDLAEKYSVMSVPTLIFFKGGRELSRITGGVKKSDMIRQIENIQKGE